MSTFLSKENTPGCMWELTCIAPIFSINWSALEAPSKTELTPSFLRHQAEVKERVLGAKYRALKSLFPFIKNAVQSGREAALQSWTTTGQRVEEQSAR